MAEYTDSSMPKLKEGILLFKSSIGGAERRASRLFETYSMLRDEFDLDGKDILEIGANSTAGIINLFDDSQNIVAIDLYLGMLDEGLWKASKNIVRKLFFDQALHRALRKLNGGKFHKRSVQRMDATNMEFGDSSFDFLYSRYLLEHVEDIEGIAREAYRCLRPGGSTYHVLALYSHLDGAHTLDWTKHEPWQHLYGTVQGNSYVNKYRLAKYKTAFEKYFGPENTVVRVKENNRYKDLLTPEMREKLADYSDEELIGGSPEIICRKP
jgi:ubiquinone/menaquinone biosynthesis C-methylase UbiE